MKVIKFFKKYPFVFILLLLLLTIVGEFVIDQTLGNGNGFISRKLYKKVTVIDLVVVVLFTGFIATFFLWINENKLKDFISRQIDAKEVSYIRFLYVLIALPMAIQNFFPLKLLHFGVSDSYLMFYQALNVLWIILLLLMLIGCGGKIKYILNFICVCLVLHLDVGREQLKLISFFMIFLNLDSYYSLTKSDNKTTYTWPLYILMYCHAITVFMAGISKQLDPVWVEGLGFYYTLMQPWLKQTVFFDNLLNNEFIMLVMNYGTVYSEILILPLVLFKKTRVWGIILTFLMFIMLTLIFRIDAIGPSGLLIGFIMIYCSDTAKKILTPASLFSRDVPIYVKNENTLNKVSFFLIITLITTSVSTFIMVDISKGKLFAYPRVSYPFIVKKDKPVERSRFVSNFNLLHGVLGKGAKFNLIYAWYQPFNFHHFLGRYYYKVVTTYSDGSTEEVLQLFEENGITKFFGVSGAILIPRVFQDKISHVQYVSNLLAYDKEVPESLCNPLKGIILLSMKNSSKKDIQHVSIYEKPVVVPPDFQGNVQLWRQINWIELYRYSHSKNQFEFVEKPIKLDFSKFRFLTRHNIEFQP